MKLSYTPAALIAVLTFTLASGPSAFAQNKSVANMRDVASHDDLSRKLRMAQQADPIREIGPPKGKVNEDPAAAMSQRDLIKNSTIFSYRGFLTLVPNRSVLHVPAHLQGRLAAQDGAKVQTWKQFFQSNRGWIRTLEVSREQALGHVPFSEEVSESIAESSVVVVATYKGGPISVLPLKAEEEVPSRADMKPVTFR